MVESVFFVFSLVVFPRFFLFFDSMRVRRFEFLYGFLWCLAGDRI